MQIVAHLPGQPEFNAHLFRITNVFDAINQRAVTAWVGDDEFKLAVVVVNEKQRSRCLNSTVREGSFPPEFVLDGFFGLKAGQRLFAIWSVNGGRAPRDANPAARFEALGDGGIGH